VRAGCHPAVKPSRAARCSTVDAFAPNAPNRMLSPRPASSGQRPSALHLPATSASACVCCPWPFCARPPPHLAPLLADQQQTSTHRLCAIHHNCPFPASDRCLRLHGKKAALKAGLSSRRLTTLPSCLHPHPIPSHSGLRALPCNAPQARTPSISPQAMTQVGHSSASLLRPALC
jgi:hypothetical protein